MIKSCLCGVEFEAKRASRKWCSDRCKTRNARGRLAPVVPVAAVVVLDAATFEGDLYVVTRRELEAAGRVDTSAGQRALLYARRLDSTSGESGAGVAALGREHGATMAEATRGLKVAGDLLDELKARRDRIAAG